MDGSFGPMALRSLELTRWLRQGVKVPVRLWDERLTTQQAQSVGKDAAIDEKAAAILLNPIWTQGLRCRRSTRIVGGGFGKNGLVNSSQNGHNFCLLVSLGSIHTLKD